HIDATTFDAAWKQRMKGEAYFLRAYFYHNLMRMYGGVPLITKVYGLNEDYKVARNSFKETVDFIVANADSAAALLPTSYTGGGAELRRPVPAEDQSRGHHEPLLPDHSGRRRLSQP